MSFFFTRFTRASMVCGALWAVFAGALLLAGCGGSEAQETEAGYKMGEAVEDSTIAAIASAGDFTDTLAYTKMERGMNQLTQGRFSRLPDSTQKKVQRVSLMRFITRAAQVAEARKRGLKVDTTAVNQQVQGLRARVGGDSLFQARLAQSGMSMSDLRHEIHEQLLVRNLQETLADEAQDPTAEDVNTYRTDQAREVRVQQILFDVPPRASQGQRDSVKMRAQTVLDSIQSGKADFGAMAQRYSRGGGDEKGSLGYQTRQQMAGPFARRGQEPADVPFVQRAFALEDSGDVASEPVRTRYGYHLLRQTGARTGQRMDSTQAAQKLAQERRQKAVTQAVEDLRKTVTLRLNSSRVTADMTQPLANGTSQDEG